MELKFMHHGLRHFRYFSIFSVFCPLSLFFPFFFSHNVSVSRKQLKYLDTDGYSNIRYHVVEYPCHLVNRFTGSFPLSTTFLPEIAEWRDIWQFTKFGLSYAK